VAVTESYPEVANGQHFVLGIPFLIIKVTLRDMHIGADAPQVVVHLLRVHKPSCCCQTAIECRGFDIAAKMRLFEVLQVGKVRKVGLLRARAR